MPQRHKHADVIHAYAEGAKVQFREYEGQPWDDTSTPVFSPDLEYRVKPNAVELRYRRYVRKGFTAPFVVSCHMHGGKFNPEEETSFVTWIDDDWQTFEVQE